MLVVAGNSAWMLPFWMEKLLNSNFYWRLFWLSYSYVAEKYACCGWQQCLEVAEPLRLVVVLRGQDARVQEHQGHHHPEHGLQNKRIKGPVSRAY